MWTLKISSRRLKCKKAKSTSSAVVAGGTNDRAIISKKTSTTTATDSSCHLRSIMMYLSPDFSTDLDKKAAPYKGRKNCLKRLSGLKSSR